MKEMNVTMGLNLLVLVLVAGRCLAQLSTGPETALIVEDLGRLPPQETDRPIIGILCQELSPKIREVSGDHDCYIAASYVKFVEGAGARVAPILIGQDPEYYVSMASKVNGLLLPGGATYFDRENGYAAAGKQLYRIARDMNERGDHFPVLAICLGMELLAVVAAGEDFRRPCVSVQPLPLKFMPGSKETSRLFARAPINVLRTLEKENVTANSHRLCVTPEDMDRHNLTREWRPLTLNEDANGLQFVSTIEHQSLPFYGVQFHPEKNTYEWKRSKNYPHSESAIAATRYFADFLVSEARRNRHSFPEDEERDQLIYRHQPVDTRGKLMWEQLYLFSSSRGSAGSASGTRQ